MKLFFFAMTLAILLATSLAQTGGCSSGGAMFTRWGRTECPAGNDLVYKGYAGGTHYLSTGGAANYLCMPEDPQYGNTSTTSAFEGVVYGAEWQTWKYSPFHDQSNSDYMTDHDVPCAVCRNTCANSILMVPAKRECHTSWKFEYSGYLMSNHQIFAGRTEYVCMDGEPEVGVGSPGNEDGVLFYSVKSACTPLPCPPYIQQAELTCVVCSHC